MAKTKQEEKYTMLEQFVDDVEVYLGREECEVMQDGEIVNIWLDLPDTENYNYFINKIEKMFSKIKWDVEDWEIDGDYEGHIELVYIGE